MKGKAKNKKTDRSGANQIVVCVCVIKTPNNRNKTFGQVDGVKHGFCLATNCRSDIEKKAKKGKPKKSIDLIEKVRNAK